MNIAIVGSGNVATVMARGIADLPDANVTQIISRNPNNARQLADMVGAEASGHLADLRADFDICMLAISDDAIAKVADHLPIHPDKIYVHTSGSVSGSVLSKHGRNGVFYPLQTISKNRNLPWSEIPLFLTASDPATLGMLSALASKLGAPHQKISDEQRSTLHLAAVFANNFSNAMYSISDQILASADLDFAALKPLIAETARKAQELKPSAAQTGPALRGDVEVMEKHLKLMQNNPEWQEIYRKISVAIGKKS